jgi:hypothetical protein
MIALSSMEPECMSLSAATQAAITIGRLMIADIFTLKALPKPLFQRLRTLLGLQFFDSSGSGRLSE